MDSKSSDSIRRRRRNSAMLRYAQIGKLRGFTLRLMPLLVFFVGAALASGADWLSLRGNPPQNTGWQRDEKILNARTVVRLRLLWQQKLSDAPSGVTDPIILGPIITHRGIKELVFVQNSAGSVYAIDADLGRIFWERSLGLPAACPGGRPVQPTMQASPVSEVAEEGGNDEGFSDGNRPLYTLTASGMVFPLRPSTGDDFAPPFRFLPPTVSALRVEAFENTLNATVSKTCGGVADSSWSVPVSAAGIPAAQRAPAAEAKRMENVVEFRWNGRSWRATADPEGRPLVQPADSGLMPHQTLHTSRPLATWIDAEGTRWLCSATQDSVAAFRVQQGKPDEPDLSQSWRLSNLNDPGAPVVANGIVYLLSKTAGSSLALQAVNAITGGVLYTSKDLLPSRGSSGNLAVANGHVCFSTSDSRLYCFGLPFQL